MYNPYNIGQQTYNYSPYQTDNTTVSGYNVPTDNANNTNG